MIEWVTVMLNEVAILFQISSNIAWNICWLEYCLHYKVPLQLFLISKFCAHHRLHSASRVTRRGTSFGKFNVKIELSSRTKRSLLVTMSI